MEVQRARDIMTTDVITVSPNATVQEVARLLADRRIGGVPVIDDEGAIVGIVTESDLIERVAGPHVPPHIELLGGIIYLERPHEIKEHLRKAMGIIAREIMSADVITVDEDMTVSEIAEIMINKHVNRLPVLKQGRLTGIITRHDIISTLR